MAAKVYSTGPPAFKKPVPMTPPLTTWDPAFLKRKAELPEQIFTLKSGRFLGYYAEGKPEDPAVLCFASAGFNVSSLIPKEPVPGAFMVYVNQMGHGGSSPLESKVVFSERVPEILELADGLKIEKFHVSGHSCGGVLASQIAAAYPERVLGLAIISSPGNMYHSSISKKERKEIDKAGAANLDMSGCMGVLFRKLALDGNYYYADKSKDFGFTGHAVGGYSYYMALILAAARRPKPDLTLSRKCWTRSSTAQFHQDAPRDAGCVVAPRLVLRHHHNQVPDFRLRRD